MFGCSQQFVCKELGKVWQRNESRQVRRRCEQPHLCQPARKSNTGKHLSKGLSYLTFGIVVFVNQPTKQICLYQVNRKLY